MNPNKFHMSGTYFEGGSLKCYQSKAILKIFYAASFSILFVQHLTKRMDTTEVMHFHRTTQQSVFFSSFLIWKMLIFDILWNILLIAFSAETCYKKHVHLRQLREKKKCLRSCQFWYEIPKTISLCILSLTY